MSDTMRPEPTLPRVLWEGDVHGYRNRIVLMGEDEDGIDIRFERRTFDLMHEPRWTKLPEEMEGEAWKRALLQAHDIPRTHPDKELP